MKSVLRTFLFALLVAALPLRGYAGTLMLFCGTQHGASAADAHAHEGDHERGAEHSHHSHEARDDGEGTAHTASVCSVCASCCAGAGLANDEFALPAAFGVPGTHRIPFLARAASGFVPAHPDRPPLAA